MKNCEITSALRAPYSTSFMNADRSQGRGRQSRAPISRNISLRSQLLAACAVFATATPALAATDIITTHSLSEVKNGTVNPVFDSGTVIVSAGDGAQQTLTTNLTIKDGDGVISVDRFVTLTASGNITDASGNSGTLDKTGTGTLILSGANSYSGGTNVFAGLLSGTTTSLQGAIRNEDKVEFKQATAGTYAGVMSGGGQLIKNGVGTVTLSGANSYTGGTLISQGKLIGTTTSLQGAISGSGAVEFSQDTNGTYAGVISGALSFKKLGDGTVTLTGANSYSDGTIISGGRLVGNSTSLQGDIFNFRQLEFAQDTDGTYAGEMRNSGTLIKSGAGTLTLTGENSFDGGTLVAAGRLTASTMSLEGDIINGAIVEFAQASAGSYTDEMSGTGQLIKTGGGTLILTGANTYSGGTLVSAGALEGNAKSIQGDIVNNGLVEFVQNTAGTYAGAMSGAGMLFKSGFYNLTLTGANSYTGGTNVAQGNLVGNTTSLQGAITGNGTARFNQDTDGTYAGVLSGNVAFEKYGYGTVTLTGANSNTGGFWVAEGRLVGNTGTFLGAITTDDELEFAQATDGTYGDVIDGGGKLIKTGVGTLTLTGANDYYGGTLLSAGRLVGDTTSLQGDIINNAKLEFAQASDGTYAGVVSGTGQLIKTGYSTLKLTGANTYSGGTVLSSGDLEGDTTSLQGAITGIGSVAFHQDDNGTYAGAMSGDITLHKYGAGTVTLKGANTYRGSTLVWEGRLAGDTTSLQGIIYNDAELEFAQDTDGSHAGEISGIGQLIKSGTGTVTLTGAYSYVGGTLVSAGRLVGDTISLQGDIENNAKLEFAQSTDGLYAGVVSGTGRLVKSGSGTLTLSGANTYTGGTLVSEGRLVANTAVLQGDIVNVATVEFAQGTDGTYTGALSGTGQFVKTGAGNLTLTAESNFAGATLVSAGRLTGNAMSLKGAIVNDAVVEFAQGADGSYAGAMSGNGALIKTGGGTLTLTGAHSYAGGTLVAAGRLAGDTKSLQGIIINNGAVEFAQATDGRFTGEMYGTGQVIKTGSGRLALTGPLGYTGSTLVSAGRLAGDTMSLGGDVTNDAELEFAQGADGVYAGVVSGTGKLIKTGAGTLVLTGANTYSGGTLVSAGRLLGDTIKLQGAIENNATVEFAQSTDGTYTGALSGTGQFIKTGAGNLTLTAESNFRGSTLVSAGRLTGNAMSLKGAIVNQTIVEFAQSTDGTYAGAMSGNGKLVKTGAGTLTLTGAHSYTGGTLVTAGRLTGDATSLRGVIINDAAVEFAQATDGSFTGEMSGTGRLIKTGSGRLALTGRLAYTGGTLVSGGRLAGDTMSLRGDVTNDAELEFAQGTDGVYAGVVSGTGKLVKTGAGTLVLTGANSYTGGSLVSAGRLAGDTSTLQGAIVNDATVEFMQATDGTYAGAMSGTGQFVKTGAGNLTLTGESNFAGSTLVSAGRLTGNTMSLKGAIVNDAVVEFAQGADGSYAGAMSGNGGLVKTGAGTLTLTGAHSYAGGTLVAAGRLAGDATSLQGVILNDGAVEFTQATDGIYSSDMGGSGAFYKSGTGALTLAGISSIKGVANVSAGLLKVAGQLAAESVTVQNTATLGGNGVIGGNVVVQNGGSLAPGASPGTLSVVGNVSFLTGSNFGVEIDGRTYNPAGGAGSHDLLRVSGVANLAGTIAPTLRGITGNATNTYVPSLGDSFVVLSAGTITGNFNDIAQPAGDVSDLRFDAVYGGDFVRLVVTPGSFAQLGNGQDWNGNVSRAARGIDSARLAVGARNGASQTLFNGLYGMNADQLETAFGQISGETYASSLQSVTATERSTFSAAIDALGVASSGTSDGNRNMNGSVWGRYVGTFANHNADKLASGYNNSSSGILMGATLNDGDLLQFGVAASYVESKVSSSLAATANTNSTGGYLYMHYTPSDNFNVSNVLGVSLSKTHTSRSVGTTTGRVTADSDTQSRTIMYGTKASYRGFVNGSVSLWADAGLELSDTSTGRVQERAVNSDFALVIDKTNHRSAEAQMSARLQLTSDNAKISLSAGSIYELGDDSSAARNVKLGGASWTIQGVDKQRHGIRLGMQSRAQLSKRVSLSSSYQHTNQGHGYSYDRANVGLNFAF